MRTIATDSPLLYYVCQQMCVHVCVFPFVCVCDFSLSLCSERLTDRPCQMSKPIERHIQSEVHMHTLICNTNTIYIHTYAYMGHAYTSIYAWPLLCLSVALADYGLWDVSLVKLFSSSVVCQRGPFPSHTDCSMFLYYLCCFACMYCNTSCILNLYLCTCIYIILYHALIVIT